MNIVVIKNINVNMVNVSMTYKNSFIFVIFNESIFKIIISFHFNMVLIDITHFNKSFLDLQILLLIFKSA